ncbi:hypothetical protein HII31_10791 [Pseudocercospora fuligena]|uniref:Heterokaryon incompatibility domain-containing protein n=1 Tax=Pseudocercospora fuligena TaxID=685502 RepID=A0A8H6R8G0_9PEZI|nr:hypothetical protein HII31_10791 [Pseudocercospora fuligena]
MRRLRDLALILPRSSQRPDNSISSRRIAHYSEPSPRLALCATVLIIAAYVYPLVIGDMDDALRSRQGRPFQYENLESQTTFRLLNLRPGEGEKLECSLHHFTLGSDACPPYRAISYTWDKEPARHKLQMPGDSVIWIRKNLASALKAMRDKDNDCWLWIDAICIHQDSNDERAHRNHLTVDYNATPVQRLVAIMDFVHRRENLRAGKVLEFADLLKRLFKIEWDDVLQEQDLCEGLTLVIPATVLGFAQLPPESKGSEMMRKRVKPLDPMPVLPLDTSQDPWRSSMNQGIVGARQGVSPQDMTFFGIANTGLPGLAACRLRQGDTIWHFPRTHLVFAVRKVDNQRSQALGRAYLFSGASRDPRDLQLWQNQNIDYDNLRQGEQNVSMSLANLLGLTLLAVMVREDSKDPLPLNKLTPESRLARVSMRLKGKAGAPGWQNLHALIQTLGSALIFAFMLTVVLLQVLKA